MMVASVLVVCLALTLCAMGGGGGKLLYAQWYKGTKPIKLRPVPQKLTALLAKILM